MKIKMADVKHTFSYYSYIEKACPWERGAIIFSVYACPCLQKKTVIVYKICSRLIIKAFYKKYYYHNFSTSLLDVNILKYELLEIVSFWCGQSFICQWR